MKLPNNNEILHLKYALLLQRKENELNILQLVWRQVTNILQRFDVDYDAWLDDVNTSRTPFSWSLVAAYFTAAFVLTFRPLNQLLFGITMHSICICKIYQYLYIHICIWGNNAIYSFLKDLPVSLLMLCKMYSLVVACLVDTLHTKKCVNVYLISAT